MIKMNKKLIDNLSKGANIEFKVSGFHFEKGFKPRLIEEVPGTRQLVTKLPTGEKIYKVKVRVFVQEAKFEFMLSAPLPVAFCLFALQFLSVIR